MGRRRELSTTSSIPWAGLWGILLGTGMGSQATFPGPMQETSGYVGSAPSKVPHLFLLAHGLWQNPTPPGPPPNNTSCPQGRHQELTQSPAHLLSCLTIPARKPIWARDTLGALSPHHAPRPWQPLQALGT